MKYEIEVEGLPEGYEIVDMHVTGSTYGKDELRLPVIATVKKKQPRRIVLESTEETRQPIAGEYVFNNGNFCLCRKPERWGNEHEIWRRVEDTNSAPTEDLPEFLKPQAE